MIPVTPQHQGPFQPTVATRHVASAPSQPRLLGAHRAVDPLDVGRIDLTAQPQLLDLLADVLQSTPTRTAATAMARDAEDVQDRLGVRPMIVRQDRQRLAGITVGADRGHQRLGHFQGPRPDAQIDHESGRRHQGHMNPRTARTTSLTASSGRSASLLRSAPFFAGADRPCNSSSSTTWRGSFSFSSCRRWKSSARRPAFSKKDSTVPFAA